MQHASLISKPATAEQLQVVVDPAWASRKDCAKALQQEASTCSNPWLLQIAETSQSLDSCLMGAPAWGQRAPTGQLHSAPCVHHGTLPSRWYTELQGAEYKAPCHPLVRTVCCSTSICALAFLFAMHRRAASAFNSQKGCLGAPGTWPGACYRAG